MHKVVLKGFNFCMQNHDIVVQRVLRVGKPVACSIFVIGVDLMDPDIMRSVDSVFSPAFVDGIWLLSSRHLLHILDEALKYFGIPA